LSAQSQPVRLAAEFIGTMLLLAAVVGSGIMAAKLSGGNIAIALLANALATGAALYVLINIFGPVSGAHFNPAVTGVMLAKGEIKVSLAAGYMLAQIGGGIAGVLLAHGMFDLALLQISTTVRSSPGQWLSEVVATAGLILTILSVRKHKPDALPMAIALYIVAAYWFTASTSFANPAVTLARALTDTFAGIRPVDVPFFVIAQLAGAIVGALIDRLINTRA
jgi:glycerol uptake facilitator-like aquaporin